MKKASLLFMMCIFVLGMHAKELKKLSLEQVALCESHPGSWQNRHKAPGKKPLQVYCDGEFVYLQNAIVGGHISFLDEFGNVLYEETISASECVIEKPQSAIVIQISYGDVVLIGYLNSSINKVSD